MRMSTLHIIRKIISKLLCGCRGSLNTEFSSFICNSVSLSGDYSRTGKGTPVNRALLGNLWLTCSSHSRPYVLRKSHFRMGFRASWRVTSVQLRSCVWLCDPMDCSAPGFPVRHQFPELVQTPVLRVDDAIRPSLLSPSPPALKVPSIRVFSSESALCISWPKDWSFSFSISPSNEHPGLISFRMDWLDLLAVQGALKSLLQHHSSKASILQCSAFCTVQLSHPYMTTGESLA